MHRLWEKSERLRSLSEDARLIMTAKYRARYIGYVGFGNLGDQAIFSSTKALFLDRIKFHSAWRPGIPPTMLKHFLPFHAVFLGGGTLIKATSRHLKRLEDNLSLFPRSRFIVFGTGVGDTDLWESFGKVIDRKRWLELLGRSHFLAVRGYLSKQYLRDLGFTNEIHVIGDPAVYFSRERVVSKDGRKRIGINLGPSNGFIFGRDEYHVLEFGASLLRFLTKDGWDVTLFPVVRDDVEYLTQAVKMAGIEMPKMHRQFLDLRSTLAALEEQDVFLGEKLHSVVLASCVGTPAIMLGYRSKCRDFMISIGRESWFHRTDELDMHLIVDQLTELHENLGKHQSEVIQQMNFWKECLEDAAEQVWEIIKDK